MPQIEGSQTGGSDILSYNLQFNTGGISQIFQTIVGEAPDNLMLVITKGGLSTNVFYQFRYRVRNKFGWSNGYSPLLTAITASIPSMVAPPTFSIIN